MEGTEVSQRVLSGKVDWVLSTFEEGSVCLKRPAVQVGNRIIQRQFLIWPSLSLLGEYLGYRPSHHIYEKESKNDWRGKVGKEILRFLQEIFGMQRAEGLDRVVVVLKNVYTLAALPTEGSIPQCGGRYLCPRLPVTIDDFLDKDPLEKLVSYHYPGVVVLPLRERIEEIVDEPRTWDIGYKWRGNSTAHRSFLYKLDLVAQEKEFCVYVGSDGLDRLLSEYFDPGLPVYEYEIIRFVPYHLREF